MNAALTVVVLAGLLLIDVLAPYWVLFCGCGQLFERTVTASAAIAAGLLAEL
jgi:hypothetical protein